VLSSCHSREDEAFGITSSMKPKSFYTDPFHALANILDIDDDDETYGCFLSTEILESKYKKAYVQDVANRQTHLTKVQQEELHTLFAKRKTFLWQTRSLSFQENGFRASS
jgi:hypothetical protein